MEKIESKTGWLKAVDTDRHTMDIQLESNIIPVTQPGAPGEQIPSNLKRYNYAENIEWEDEYFYDNIGEKVKIRLSDNIVEKIELA